MSTQYSMFFNTVGYTGDQLKAVYKRCQGQAREVFDIFNSEPTQLLTPLEVCDKVAAAKGLPTGKQLPATIIISYRRAISALKKHGLLVKTDKSKKERFGITNHYYKLNLQTA